MNDTDILKDILIAARAKITDPKNWVRKSYARDSNGLHQYGNHPDAICFCSLGAVQAAMSTEYNHNPTLYYQVMSLLNSVTDTGMISYNDSHTHEEVLAVFDKAIENCSTKQNQDLNHE